MIRWLLWLLAGLLLGGIVHIRDYLISSQYRDTECLCAHIGDSAGQSCSAVADAERRQIRTAADGPGFCGRRLPLRPDDGPLTLTTPVSPAYTSVTFYTNKDVAYYAINDRAAGRRTIELDLMTSAQRAQLPDDEEVAAADRLIVESPSQTGLIVMRALAPEPGMMPAAIASLSGARCVRIAQ